ncbi:MAG: hypothetical protein K2I93_07810 [Oscillospiraceae bacterium]|nr:hypothetical protein [Oscillospiraceae bacterium]
MHPWLVLIIEVLIAFVLIAGIIVNVTIFLTAKKKKLKSKIRPAVLILNCILLIAFAIFLCSHKTYYKYNDWAILNSNIYMVREKYGEFDEGELKENDNSAGTVGYYIYTDNGPFLPDHLRHYYYMAYDVWGMVYEVYDACERGG